jgi:hypothetical protein
MIKEMQLFSRFLDAIHFVFQNTSRLISRRYFSRAKILSDDIIMLVSDSCGESRRRSDERRLQIYQHLSICTSNARHDAENDKCLIRILRLKHDSIPRSDGQLIFEHNVETAIPGIWKDLKVPLTDIRVSMAQENQASMMRKCTTRHCPAGWPATHCQSFQEGRFTQCWRSHFEDPKYR